MKILVVQPDASAVSETFLEAQARRLPGEVRLAYCEAVTRLDGRPVLPQQAPLRLWRKARRTFLREGWDQQQRGALNRLVAGSGADVVLAQFGPSGVWAMPGARAGGIPLVVHFHGYDATRTSTLERFGADYREMFRQAAAVIAVSGAMREQLISLGCPAEKVHRIPYGTDTSRFQGAEPAGSPPHFLAVGRLIEKKAPYLTLTAFARVRQRFPEARLTMIGDGPLRGVCEDLVDALELAEAVHLAGAQPHEVVQREMAAARCFVQHSQRARNGDCEGTPVAVIEAGASGLPVVATRHAGIGEVVQTGKTGLLVEERDLAGMTEAMLAIAGDGHYAARLGQAARRRIEVHYGMNESIGRLSEVLAEAANPADSQATESSKPTQEALLAGC